MGPQAYAGYNAMTARRDAVGSRGSRSCQSFPGLAERILGQKRRADVGKVGTVKPGGANVIPDEVEFTVDIRAPGGRRGTASCRANTRGCGAGRKTQGLRTNVGRPFRPADNCSLRDPYPFDQNTLISFQLKIFAAW